MIIEEMTDEEIFGYLTESRNFQAVLFAAVKNVDQRDPGNEDVIVGFAGTKGDFIYLKRMIEDEEYRLK
jgi:hypothetical protein